MYHLTIDQTIKYELCTSNYDSDANDLRCHVSGRSHENREQKPLFIGMLLVLSFNYAVPVLFTNVVLKSAALQGKQGIYVKFQSTITKWLLQKPTTGQHKQT